MPDIPASAASSSSADRIAVTVIGGYLGSGKTTLVNNILRDATERIAVLVNDFGAINIDADLIERRGENTLELANGCICCSIVDGFAAVLDSIIAMDPRPDRLVIEASGVSDPAQVAAWGHGPGLVLDAVIGLVDSETIRAQTTDKYVGQTVTQQLKSAHVLVANKSDLVSPDELAEVTAWLSENHPDAFVFATRDAQVPPEVLFGRRNDSPLELSGAHVHAEDVFETWTYEATQPTTKDAIAELMAAQPASVVRAKGLVWLDGSDQPGVLQRVGRRHTLRRMGAWPDQPRTQIVFIAVREN